MRLEADQSVKNLDSGFFERAGPATKRGRTLNLASAEQSSAGSSRLVFTFFAPN
jgi:hypothetical protein